MLAQAKLICSLFFVDMILVQTNNIPKVARIGGVFPMFIPGTSTVDKNGIQYLAAFLMAIREINDKNDGYYDDLLPNTQLKAAVRFSEGDFIHDVYGAIDLTTAVFNGTGVMGVVGAAENSASSNIAQIFNGFATNQVAYGSTGSYLSYIGPYPYYFRTCSNDAFQGYALAEIIHKHYLWDAVSIFSSTDSYGSDLFQQFYIRATQLGISVVSIHQFRSGLANFSPQIKDAKSRGTRIFVLLMKGEDAGKLLEQGHSAGLFRPDTQIVGSNQVVSAAAWTTMSSNAPVQDIFKGALSVSQSFAYDYNTILDFARRWVLQNDTVTVDPNSGLETCHAGMDDDGGVDLYKGKVKTATGETITKCAGLQFSSQFKADGTGIADYAPFAYDATVALAQGLHDYIYKVGYETFDGDALGAIMAFNFSADGVTGPISFRLGDSTGYGYGDREAGIKFTLNNFQPNLYCPIGQTGGLASIGTWDVVNLYRPCKSCKAVYNTLTNSPPLDKPVPITVGLSVGNQSLMIVLGVLCLVLILVIAAALAFYRKKKLVKSAQPPMLYIVLVGGSLASVRVFAAAVPLSTATCIMFDWFGHLAFACVFGSLLIKTWRVHIIVNSSMRRIKITTERVLIMALCVILFVAVYLIALTVIGQPHLAYTVQDLGLLQFQLHPRCGYRYSEFSTALYVLEAVTLVQGVRLCWLTRNVPDAVNDSKNIATSMYAIAFVSAIVFPIVFLLPIYPEVRLLISSVGFAIATLSAMATTFIPKMYLLLLGAELDAKMGIVMPNGSRTHGSVKIASTDTDTTPMYASEAEAKLQLTKHSREDDVKVARDQILMWQKMLLQIENRALISSGSTGSTASRGPREKSMLSVEMSNRLDVLEEGHEDHALLVEREVNAPEVDGVSVFRTEEDYRC